VFYLFAQDLVLMAGSWVASSAELRSVDLGSGETDSVLPGVAVTDYDISADEKEVAFTTTDRDGESQIWLAPLDRRTPPRQVARDGDQVSFGADGDLVFRSLEGTTNVPVRIKKDGSGRERMTAVPILEKFGVSPDGEWVIVFALGVGEDSAPATLAVPLDGGAPRKVCTAFCRAVWSSDGRFFYVAADRGASVISPGKTLAIPVPVGKSLPDLPDSGVDLVAGGIELPGAQVIEHDPLSPGRDPSTYVFTKTDLQRNLFRIPLH
jgi:hypothetical protein